VKRKENLTPSLLLNHNPMDLTSVMANVRMNRSLPGPTNEELENALLQQALMLSLQETEVNPAALVQEDKRLSKELVQNQTQDNGKNGTMNGNGKLHTESENKESKKEEKKDEKVKKENVKKEKVKRKKKERRKKRKRRKATMKNYDTDRYFYIV